MRLSLSAVVTRENQKSMSPAWRERDFLLRRGGDASNPVVTFVVSTHIRRPITFVRSFIRCSSLRLIPSYTLVALYGQTLVVYRYTM